MIGRLVVVYRSTAARTAPAVRSLEDGLIMRSTLDLDRNDMAHDRAGLRRVLRRERFQHAGNHGIDAGCLELSALEVVVDNGRRHYDIRGPRTQQYVNVAADE